MDIDFPTQETGELCYSRNLLQRFAGTYRKLDDPADSCDVGIELGLGLGLSLGTCNRLARSSSVAAFPAEIEFSGSGEGAALARASSLPGEEMKRKEMQGLKRMEFKRKRLEKRGGLRLPETAGIGRELAAGGGGRGLGGPQVLVSTNSSVPPSTPPAGHKSASRAPLPPPLRSLKSLQEEEDDVMFKSNLNSSKHVGKNTMADMPFVSTKESGPNSRRVEGFLYKYKRGEEVRIVCICHGNFHTPAEFVKHAGGGDVPHPLRQIVVNPSPSVYY